MILSVQVAIKASIRHVVVDQKELFMAAIAEQLHKVTVTKMTKDDDLSHELLHPLLNSNCLLGDGQHSFVDTSKPSPAKKHPVLKSIGGSQEIFVGERWRLILPLSFYFSFPCFKSPLHVELNENSRNKYGNCNNWQYCLEAMWASMNLLREFLDSLDR